MQFPTVCALNALCPIARGMWMEEDGQWHLRTECSWNWHDTFSFGHDETKLQTTPAFGVQWNCQTHYRRISRMWTMNILWSIWFPNIRRLVFQWMPTKTLFHFGQNRWSRWGVHGAPTNKEKLILFKYVNTRTIHKSFRSITLNGWIASFKLLAFDENFSHKTLNTERHCILNLINANKLIQSSCPLGPRFGAHKKSLHFFTFSLYVILRAANRDFEPLTIPSVTV